MEAKKNPKDHSLEMRQTKINGNCSFMAWGSSALSVIILAMMLQFFLDLVDISYQKSIWPQQQNSIFCNVDYSW